MARMVVRVRGSVKRELRKLRRKTDDIYGVCPHSTALSGVVLFPGDVASESVSEGCRLLRKVRNDQQPSQEIVMTRQLEAIRQIPIRERHGFTYAEAAVIVLAKLPTINEILAQKGRPPAKCSASIIRQMRKFLADGIAREIPAAIEAAQQCPGIIAAL